MQDKHNVSRRKILKSLAVGGAIAAGVPVATASETELPEDTIESILQKPEVVQIAEIIGKFDISQGEQTQYEESEQQVTLTKLKDKRGVLTYTEFESGSAAAKFIIEDLTGQSALRQKLTKEYGFIPEDSGMEIGLFSSGDSVRLVRESASDELQKIQLAIINTERDAAAKEAVYDSEIQGYRVFTENAEDSSDISQYLVGAGGLEISAANVELVDDDVSIQGCPWTLSCAMCAKAIVDRGICLAACASGPGPLCIACVVSSTFYPLACVPCLNECA